MDRDQNINLPEAPASVTARVISDQGFHLLFTLRDTSVSGLIKKFDEFQNYILSHGWKPESFGKAQSQEETRLEKGQEKAFASEISAPKKGKAIKSSQTTCAICGATATKKSGYRKDGSLWEGVFCSTGEESHKVWLS